jgi:hypothetical protein
MGHPLLQAVSAARNDPPQFPDGTRFIQIYQQLIHNIIVEWNTYVWIFSPKKRKNFNANGAN